MRHNISTTDPEIPRVGVGAIVVHEGRILLVKRAGEPGRGLWAIPGGRLKPGETLKECAAREILEETGVTIGGRRWYFMCLTFIIPKKNQNGRTELHLRRVDFGRFICAR